MTEVSRREINGWLVVSAIGALSGAAFTTGASAAVPPGYLLHPQKGLIPMTKDLGRLGAEHFEALVGETFVVGGQPVTLRAVRRGPPTPARFRQQFALTFDIPEGSAIRSEVVPVAHPAIGEQNLLVTQVIDSQHPTALEICFS